MIFLPLLPAAVMAAWGIQDAPTAIDSWNKIGNAILLPIYAIAVATIVIMFFYSAILFATAAGEPDKISKAKKSFLWGLVAVIVLIIVPVIITIMREITGI